MSRRLVLLNLLRLSKDVIRRLFGIQCDKWLPLCRKWSASLLSYSPTCDLTVLMTPTSGVGLGQVQTS